MKSILITTCITQESDTTISFGDAEPIRLEFEETFKVLVEQCGVEYSAITYQEINQFECKEHPIETASCLVEDEDNRFSFGLLHFENIQQHQVIVLDLDYLVEVLVSEVVIPHATLGYLCSKFLPVDTYTCKELVKTDNYFYSIVESVDTGTKYLILKIK